VNKEQAEKCRDLGAAALRRGEYPRAAKMLQKSLKLYPLPGVEALYQHAQGKLREEETATNSNSSNSNNNGRAAEPQNNFTRSASTASATSQGADGRSYTAEQTEIVKSVLAAKEGGRGAHYRVLKISQSATESEIKVRCGSFLWVFGPFTCTTLLYK